MAMAYYLRYSIVKKNAIGIGTITFEGVIDL